MIHLDGPLITSAMHWASASEPSPTDPNAYCDSRDVFNARLEHLRAEQHQRGWGETADLVNAVLAEIGGNSFDHNLGQWRDLPGVYLAAELNKTSGIAVLADRGQGVRATIQRAVPGTLESDVSALQLAFLRRITGRVGERRGNGLKFVREIVRLHGMSLFFQSGNGVCEIATTADRWFPREPLVPGCLAVLSFVLT